MSSIQKQQNAFFKGKVGIIIKNIIFLILFVAIFISGKQYGYQSLCEDEFEGKVQFLEEGGYRCIANINAIIDEQKQEFAYPINPIDIHIVQND